MTLRQRKKRIFDIIQIGKRDDWPSRLFDVGLIAMILLNLFVALFATFESSRPYHGLIDRIDLVTVLAFTGEYLLRVWTAEFLYPGTGRFRASVRYMTSFNGIIDLLSFFPYYLPVFFPQGAVAFRMFRVIRILRLFQINAYYDALNVIGAVLRSKRDQLLSSIFIILVLMTASSLFMYGLEHQAQPEVFQNAFSGMWWAVSTLLTVGYGDIYPVTTAGRVFGTVLTFLGVGMVAIPTGILSAGFVEQYRRLEQLDATGLDVRFVRLEIGPDHPWAGKALGELPLPPDLLPAVVQRGDGALTPKAGTVLEPGDGLVLGAQTGQDELGISLKRVVLRGKNPWVGQRVRDLDLSRRVLIVMVTREGRTVVPDGNFRFQTGDAALLYTKKSVRNSKDVSV